MSSFQQLLPTQICSIPLAKPNLVHFVKDMKLDKNCARNARGFFAFIHSFACTYMLKIIKIINKLYSENLSTASYSQYS